MDTPYINISCDFQGYCEYRNCKGKCTYDKDCDDQYLDPYYWFFTVPQNVIVCGGNA